MNDGWMEDRYVCQDRTSKGTDGWMDDGRMMNEGTMMEATDDGTSERTDE